MFNSLVIKYILEEGVKVKQRNHIVEQNHIDLYATQIRKNLNNAYVLIGYLTQDEKGNYYLKSPLQLLEHLGDKRIIIEDGTDRPKIDTLVSALVIQPEASTHPIVKYIEEFKW